MKQKTFTVTIDLGKGVKMKAPFKKKWTLAEWRRMSAHIESSTRGIPSIEEYK